MSQQPLLYFNITLLSPNNKLTRNTWVGWIADELPKIGIGTVNHSTNWAEVNQRWEHYNTSAVTSRANYTNIAVHDEGGFDAAVATYPQRAYAMMGPGWSFRYSTDPVYNFNSNWYQNTTVDQLNQAVYSEIDEERQVALLEQLQALLYDDLPEINIMYERYGAWLINENWSLSPEEWSLLEAGKMKSGWANVGFNNITPITIGGPIAAFWMTPFADDTMYEQENWLALGMVWQGLYERDPANNLAWKPLIAAALPVWSNANKTATVKLREDVYFADGHQLTAHDVVESYRIPLTPAFHTYNYRQYPGFQCIAPNGSTVTLMPHFASNDSIVAVDNFTVEFTWTEPCGYALEWLDDPIAPIHLWGNHTHFAFPVINSSHPGTLLANVIKNDPITYGFGTGPYRYKEIVADDPWVGRYNLTLEAVDSYWNGNVTTDEIIIQELWREDFDQVLARVQNGSIHLYRGYWQGLVPSDVGSEDGFSILPSKGWARTMMTINMNHPILGAGVDTPLGQSDPARAAEAARYIRQAISHAIPRQKIVDELYEGYADLGVGGFYLPPACFGFDASLEPYAYNLTRAQELLAKAGYVPPGNDTTATESSSSSSAWSSTNTEEDDVAFPFSGFLAGLFLLAIITIKVRKKLRNNNQP